MAGLAKTIRVATRQAALLRSFTTRPAGFALQKWQKSQNDPLQQNLCLTASNQVLRKY